MNVIQQLEQEQITKLISERPVPEFAPGDTVKVHLKVVEGNRERIQVYEGVVIARKNRGINSSFTVRKLSYGEGVERVFPLYSPRIEKVEVVRRGDVRRAKLYYLRGRTGKRARIAEQTTGYSAKVEQEARVVAAEDAKRKQAEKEAARKAAAAAAAQEAAAEQAEADAPEEAPTEE